MIEKVELSPNCVVYCGDCLEVLPLIDKNSIHSCCVDPPYNLTSIVKRFSKKNAAPCKYGKDGSFSRLSKGFMGQTWDGSGVSFNPETWELVYNALLPGAHLVSFAGTRTYHRIACAIEDAGFEVRDMLSWNYASGFPKSHNVSKAIDEMKGMKPEVIGTVADFAIDGRKRKTDNSHTPTVGFNGVGSGSWGSLVTAASSKEAKQWEGWGTALKPAMEPICFARKPLSEKTVAANVLEHGTGAINIDACRIENDNEARPLRIPSPLIEKNQTRVAYSDTLYTSKAAGETTLGRFPANVMHDGSEEVLEHFPETQSGTLLHKHKLKNKNKTTSIYGSFKENKSDIEWTKNCGSAARFFYCAKASSKERDYGLENFFTQEVHSNMNSHNGAGVRLDTPYELIEGTSQAIIDEIYKYLK